MKITDNRNKRLELKWDDIESGKVYISHRLCKYVLAADDGAWLVCLETGVVFDQDECIGDVFEPVKATLVVE